MAVRPRTTGLAVCLALLAAQPAVAWAATTVSGSTVNYLTDLKIRTSNNYSGPTGGNIRLCGDQQGSIIGQGGSDTYIYRSVQAFPDTINRRLIVEGGRPLTCTPYTSSSSNAAYYTKVFSSYDGNGKYTGYARAEKP